MTARINGTTWTTSLWPKDERYLVPLKVAVRRARAGTSAGSPATRPARITVRQHR